MKSVRRALGLGVSVLETLVPRNRKRTLKGLSLYHYPACPYCLRVRFAMHRLGVAVECRDIDRRRRWREQLEGEGGKVQVPCLRIAGGDGDVWLYESAAIVDYLQARAREEGR
ncbi:glutathione S-transferase N-terminal domain-containing protein [Motiliproteus sp. SC1-56]|uniref:glutathione S-transferase N-terminal domain-containing protein n=1 Tax=Motiliproteus sp. SC1-56 TaxID=2799565 RepID=UPI001A8DABFC|nr:glutathione S-transferase N-terminal domain-containing protein [Motiliproteus sp. SC1-56]